ncbi:hypothetical protein [Sphingobacterium sp. JUb56]|uniref:TlpA family protein disulfide reductase n=1 Tax=Sphingobacterium sp. JUb56 TaxID=2587145 RepID=UPI0016088377|nr:hypothetical protein [Sphingobacterium sp. JUb56]MBB2951558.1 thiol-disulfide isomerase/thioredoxin [Sphingobacterium sp. JUb56]
MMKINLLSILCVCLLSSLKLQGQDRGEMALKIGDQFDYKKSVKTLKGAFDFLNLKSDLVILDFFMTNCTACIEAFPKNNKLQLEFGKVIKILPVSPEELTVVKNFFDNNTYTKQNRLDVVVEDQSLKELFPHNGYPHVVWVFKGKVIAITAGDMVNKKSIEEILSGKNTSEWPIKNDFDELQFVDGNYDFSSKLSDYKNGIPSSYQIDTIGDKVKYQMSNVSLLPALFYAYSKVRKLPLMKKERIQLIGLPESDFLDYQAESKSQWLKDHGFCYESFWPLGWTEEERVNALIVDLTNRMKVQASLGLADRKVWVVTKDTAVLNPVLSNDGMRVKVACTLLEINNPDFPPIILEIKDEKEKVKIGPVTNFESFKYEMQKNGFKVSEENRALDNIILKSLNK